MMIWSYFGILFLIAFCNFIILWIKNLMFSSFWIFAMSLNSRIPHAAMESKSFSEISQNLTLIMKSWSRSHFVIAFFCDLWSLLLIATSKTSRVSKRRIHLINQFCFVKYLNGMPFEVFHKSWRRTEKAQKMNFGIAGPRVRHSKRRTSKRLH